MRIGGRSQAASEVLGEVFTKHRPASEALRDWGNAHRFAGSADRAAIGNLVYDVLRQKKSLAYRINSEDPHDLVCCLLATGWCLNVDELVSIFANDRFASEFLDANKLETLANSDLSTAPDHVRADAPEWTVSSFEANFGAEWVKELSAMAERPPLDMRANTLKSTRSKILNKLKRTGAVPTAIARFGIRIPPGNRDARLPNVQSEEAFQKGHFEIQDEGSQIVSELVFAQPGENVLDYCAGAGGKTLALSAAMENRGQVHAYDTDRNRLAPIHERLRRAGTRNVQVHSPDDDLSGLTGAMDRVVVDAPCTGSGTWRRRPDSKWRVTPGNLEQRVEQQEEVLLKASPFVRSGGYLVYITCSLFPEENENQVYRFVEEHPEFELLSTGEVWEELYGHDKPQPWSSDMKTITLTPASTATDGFFFSVMERTG